MKRLLDALKAEPISEDVMPFFLTAFESLIKCNFNAEVHRTIALFITYTFHSTANSNPRTPRPSSAIGTPATSSNNKIGLRRSTVDSFNGSGLKTMTKKQVGVKILELYTRLLCQKGNYTDIHKFARTVTNKVRHMMTVDAIINTDRTLVASLPTRGRKSRSCCLRLQDHR